MTCNTLEVDVYKAVSLKKYIYIVSFPDNNSGVLINVES